MKTAAILALAAGVLSQGAVAQADEQRGQDAMAMARAQTRAEVVVELEKFRREHPHGWFELEYPYIFRRKPGPDKASLEVGSQEGDGRQLTQ